MSYKPCITACSRDEPIGKSLEKTSTYLFVLSSKLDWLYKTIPLGSCMVEEDYFKHKEDRVCISKLPQDSTCMSSTFST